MGIRDATGRGARAGRSFRLSLAIAAAAVLVPVACSSDGDARARRVRIDTAAGDPARSSTPVAPPRGVLPAGNYLTGTFRPATSFAVDDSWELESESPVSLSLTSPATADDVALVQLVDFAHGDARKLVPPIRSTPYNRSDLFADSIPFEGDYLDWLRDAGPVEVGPEEPAELGGLSGRRVSFRLGPTEEGECYGRPGACFISILTSADSAILDIQVGGQGEVYVLGHPDGPVVVVVYDPHLAQEPVAAFLSSLTIDRGSA